MTTWYGFYKRSDGGPDEQADLMVEINLELKSWGFALNDFLNKNKQIFMIENLP